MAPLDRASGITGLRERKKLATRDLIERTALELFESHGYEATTLAQIATAADVSPRTIFSYFASKEDILFAAEPVFLTQLEAALTNRPAGSTTAEALRAFLTSTDEDDQRARTRERIIASDEILRGRERARSGPLNRILSEAIATDLGTSPDDLRPVAIAAAAEAAFAAARNNRVRSNEGTPLTHAETLDVLDLGLGILNTLTAALAHQ